MSSLRRILASRANARLSRGAKSPESRERVSLNALRHGLLAKCVVLPNENAATFDAVLAEHIERFQPVDGVEFGIIEEMAAAYWRLRRAWAIETRNLAEGLETQAPGDEIGRLAGAFRQFAATPELALLHRYENRLNLMYQRALYNLLLMRSLDMPNEASPISEQSTVPVLLSPPTPSEQP